MKSYNKEATNTSYVRDPTPSNSQSSPGPTDVGNHSYSGTAHATDMAQTSSQHGSSIIDEDEDLLETDPHPRIFAVSNQEMDADTDELLDDDDFQVYPSHFSSKEQAHKWQEQQNKNYQSIK